MRTAGWTVLLVMALCGFSQADEANSLAYLDECNPWYPHTDFPKLITPQWVGEDGVEAVIVLAIDDMRDPAKYEQYLRPILNRLKQIDGRAPVSIMTNEVKPDDPQLQSWLGEGLSIECHTIDHPCPILQGGDFAKAKSTYDRCVDLMGQIPGNKPVAFRTPCCDSLNTVSPRFYNEMFNTTTEHGNFLQIDSSVFTFFTSEDESLPKELVLDANGNERFWKYLPKNNNYGGNVHNNFVNYIKNYPYPYVINNSCWQFPCMAPSDWSAQHLHGANNPVTVEDWKAAIDLTVHKQGCFSLVFHPHGWIKPEQVVELIDHAVAKHGTKVKFLNFAEVADRLNAALSDGIPNRVPLATRRTISAQDFPQRVDLPFDVALWVESNVRRFHFMNSKGETLDTSSFDHLRPSDPSDEYFYSEALDDLLRRFRDYAEEHDGFFIRDRHFCWINEDTAHLPDLMYRVSFDEVLAAYKKASGPGAPGSALRGDDGPRDPVQPNNETQHGGLTPSRSPEHPAVPIGAAVIDITPDYPVRLTGYGNRMKESEGIAARIHARALVIGGEIVIHTAQTDRDSAAERRRMVAPGFSPGLGVPIETKAPTGRQIHATTTASVAPSGLDECGGLQTPGSRPGLPGAVPPALNRNETGLTILITVDNCGIPLEMTEAVFVRVAAKHGIPRERFAISSTHSHSAPWIRGFAPNIFADVPEDHAAHLAQYESDLIEKLVEVVDKAIESRRPGYLSLGYGEAGFAMNRRLLADGKWANFGEVADGPTDKRVPVLAAHDTDGKLIAVLANYACHCTTETGDFNQISGDWAGFAADMLEADHPGAVALIAIGCGADANPSPRGTHELAKVHGRTMADEVGRVLASGPGAPGSALRVDQPANDTETGRDESEHRGLTPSGSRWSQSLRRVDPAITCNLARINLPLATVPTREELEAQAKDTGVTGSRARYFLKLLDDEHEFPLTVPDYPVQTWCFGEDLAMVFLGGEVVVDYSIRLNEMFDGDRLWINAYSNDVPCYIPSARLLREGGYETDSSMLYYRRPARLAPETEDLICDTVQKLLPHHFYSEQLQQDFPAPKSPEESLKCMTTKPDLKVVLAASEPLIRDPVAFDWDERGRLWVVEMGDYPSGEAQSADLRSSPPPRFGGEGQGEGVAALSSSVADRATPSSGLSATFSPELGGEGRSAGRIRLLTDLDGDFIYDKATTFLDNLAFPNGIHCWRGGVIVTMAPEIFYAEDTDGDGTADVRESLYQGFTEGNQQHRVNGLRWGLDGWLYLANGDSGGEIVGTGFIPCDSASGRASALRVDGAANDPNFDKETQHGGLTPNRSPASLRGRDLRINPDSNELEAVSGQSQFGRERDDFGNWFGNNNSNPIWQYVIEDRYARRNPHAAISTVTAPVSVIGGAAPVYPTSRTLARFNDFGYANRFTSACSTMIHRDSWLGEQYSGNAFTSEPVHNLVSRLVLTRDGYGFKGERADDEQQSEFLASSDNWFRPTMIRTGPDGALWIADMYRAVIEHPEWIPAEYQRKMNLYAGSDRGRIYRVVRADECCGDATQASGPGAPGSALRGDDGPKDPVQPKNKTQHGGLTPSRSLDEYFDKPWNEIPLTDLVERLHCGNGWWRDTAQRILLHRREQTEQSTLGMMRLDELARIAINPAVRLQAFSTLVELDSPKFPLVPYYTMFEARWPLDESRTRRSAIQLLEPSLRQAEPELRGQVISMFRSISDDPDKSVRLQLMLSLGEAKDDRGAKLLAQMLRENFHDTILRAAGLTSLTPENIGVVLAEATKDGAGGAESELVAELIGQAAAMGKVDVMKQPLAAYITSIDPEEDSVERITAATDLITQLNRPELLDILRGSPLVHELGDLEMGCSNVGRKSALSPERRAAAIRLLAAIIPIRFGDYAIPSDYVRETQPVEVRTAGIELAASPFYDTHIYPAADEVLGYWDSLEPVVREAALTTFLRREHTTKIILENIDVGVISPRDVSGVHRDRLLHHRNDAIAARARELFKDAAPSERAAIVADFKSQISDLKSDAVAGKAVFEKRCATCHRLQDVGKEVGADLAALKDRSIDALLTAILDPNRAVESKFLSYTVVTKNGLQQAGMMKRETGGSLTLIGSDGKEITVARAEIEELAASNRSLMPEGLEKDLSPQDLMDVIVFVQSTGSAWKRFEGNTPGFVEANGDGTITLPASAAEIHGPSLIFEAKYGNLGFWSSTDDYATWTFEVPQSGHWIVEFDFACDDSTAGSLVRLSTGNRLLTARIPGTGTWDNYQTWRAGTIDLHRGRGQLTVTAPEAPPFALLDLRTIRLLPPE